MLDGGQRCEKYFHVTILKEILKELRQKWKIALLGAVLGGIGLPMLNETIRWYLGLGFFQ
jgi:hypothetical protein